MKLKELGNVLDNKEDILIDIPEKEAIHCLVNAIYETYAEREVVRIYVDRADNDLMVELNKLDEEMK